PARRANKEESGDASPHQPSAPPAAYLWNPSHDPHDRIVRPGRDAGVLERPRHHGLVAQSPRARQRPLRTLRCPDAAPLPDLWPRGARSHPGAGNATGRRTPAAAPLSRLRGRLPLGAADLVALRRAAGRAGRVTAAAAAGGPPVALPT